MKVAISDLLVLTTSTSVGLAITAADMRLRDTAILIAIWILVVFKTWLADRNSLFYFGTAVMGATAIVLPTHFEMLNPNHWAFPFAVSDFAVLAFVTSCLVPLMRDVQRSTQWHGRHLIATVWMILCSFLSFTVNLPPALFLSGNGILALWLIQRETHKTCVQTATEQNRALKSRVGYFDF